LNPEPFQTAGQKLREWVIRWLLMAIAVWMSDLLVSGVYTDDWPSLLAAALILGILNALVKPILVMVAMPLVVLTLGFMLLFINAFLLLLTARLVPGFHVLGFGSAMWASLVISIVSMILGNSRRTIQRPSRKPPTAEAYAEPTPIRKPPPGKGPIIDV
jgi:putative membrane protein